MSRRVAVVGAGIAGLSAAFDLVEPIGSAPPARVAVFEAAGRVGGALRSSSIGGIVVDEGADAFLARRPEAVELAHRLALGDELVPPSETWASVFKGGACHRLPDGLVLGAPAGARGLVALARSPLGGPAVAARAALEPLMARRKRSGAQDDALGPTIRRRYGTAVADWLVDPLLGGINAGDAERLSLAAASPPLAGAVAAGSLLMGLARQRRATPAGPVFLTPRSGMGALPDALVARIGERAEWHLGARVESLEPVGGGWAVDGERFDGVVLAVPAWAAAPLLEPVLPDVAQVLGAVPYASVAMITMTVPTRAFAAAAAAAGNAGWPAGTGVLVPKPEQRHVTAVSFGSRKWAHWRPPGLEVLRVSVGRDGDEHTLDYDDDTLVHAVLADLADLIGLTGDPDDVRVTRWPRSFPQYRPHHLERIAAADAALSAGPPGLALAGAALRGLGVPACIGSGRRAAATLHAHLRRSPV